jgi:DegV family protein with EDD domain
VQTASRRDASVPTSVQPAVAVVTDSAASLPANAADELGISVVRMTIAIGEDVHPDGELDPAQVIQRTANHLVATSAPSPGAYLETLEELAGRPVVVATLARAMSASYESAVTAAACADGGHVDVVDTETAAGGQGLVVIAAARAAGAGGSLEEVVAAVRDVAARVRLLAFVDQLDYLARSGRVPGIAARAGRLVGVRAMFEFSRGRVRRLLPARTVDGAVARIIAACRADAQPATRLHAVVLHAEAPRATESLLAAVDQLAPDADVYAAPFSSVMVAHTGPGLAGLAWWWEPPAQSGSDAAP